MVGLVVDEVEPYQFVDSIFEINARLINLATNLPRTGEISHLKVLLSFEGNTSSDGRCKEHHPNLLEVVSNTGIQTDGTASIRLKILDISANYDNKRFVVYLEVYRPLGDVNIVTSCTNPITVVRHKLVLSEAFSSPYVWYKDEGAKDKAIKILVKLVDSNYKIVKNRIVPLTAQLIYTSGQLVQPQTVLTLFHQNGIDGTSLNKNNASDNQLMIRESGTEVIRFRVNEVSRNHRKQLFHLLVSPDLNHSNNNSNNNISSNNINPSIFNNTATDVTNIANVVSVQSSEVDQATNTQGFNDMALIDIAPAISIAFEVKSKRTSDARKEQQQQQNTISSIHSGANQFQLPNKSIPTEDDSIIDDNIVNNSNHSLYLASQSKKQRTTSSLPHSAMMSNMVESTNILSNNLEINNGTHVISNTSNSASRKRPLENGVSSASMKPIGSLQANTNNSSESGKLSGSGKVVNIAGIPIAIPPELLPIANSNTELSTSGDDSHGTSGLSLEAPRKALSAMGEYLYTTISLLSAIENKCTNNNGNSIVDGNLLALIKQLIELYPTRAVVSYQYLQQYLMLQEQHLVGNYQLLNRCMTSQRQFIQQLNHNPINFDNSAVNSHSMSQQNQFMGSISALANNTSNSINNSSGSKHSGVSQRSGGLIGNIAVPESMVTIILAKRITIAKDNNSNEELGIPAFTTLLTANNHTMTNNQHGGAVQLIGFYKLVRDFAAPMRPHNNNSSSSGGALLWQYFPLLSYSCFEDKSVMLMINDEMVDLLEQYNNLLYNENLVFDITNFDNNLAAMKQEAFAKLLRKEIMHELVERKYSKSNSL